MHIFRALFTEVITTPEIAAEYGKRLPIWVFVQAVNNRDLPYTYAEKVDLGEEVASPTLILDDLKGRKLAEQLHLKYIGTLGILILAKQKGIIPLLKTYFEKIKATNFRIPDTLLESLLKKYDG